MPDKRVNNRVPGHTLRYEGAAFERAYPSGRWIRTRDVEGVGMCSCGEVSPVLNSNNARKKWHREHKDEVRARSAEEIGRSTLG